MATPEQIIEQQAALEEATFDYRGVEPVVFQNVLWPRPNPTCMYVSEAQARLGATKYYVEPGAPTIRFTRNKYPHCPEGEEFLACLTPSRWIDPRIMQRKPLIPIEDVERAINR